MGCVCVIWADGEVELNLGETGETGKHRDNEMNAALSALYDWNPHGLSLEKVTTSFHPVSGHYRSFSL